MHTLAPQSPPPRGPVACRPAPAALATEAPPAPVDQLEQFLATLVAGLAPDPADLAHHGRGRPRILPALALWAGLIVCVLRGFRSQQALWRLLASKGLWHLPPIPVSDQAVYTRLARADDAPLAQVFADLTTLLVARLAPDADATLAPFAAGVFALDETTLDPIARSLPSLRGTPPGASQLLPGKLAGRFDVRRQLWAHLECLPNPRQNEKVAARAGRRPAARQPAPLRPRLLRLRVVR